MTRSRLLALGICLAVVVASIGGGLLWYSGAPETRLGQARRAFARGDYDAASRTIDRLLADEPNFVPARELLLRVREASAGDVMEPLAWLAEHGGDDADGYALALATHLVERQQFDQAEALYRRVLASNPNDTAAASRLAEIYSRSGRRWEALPLYMTLIRSGRYEFRHLLLAARTEDMIALPREYITQRYQDRSQVGPLLGLARFGMAKDESETAEKLLREVIEKRPDLLEAHIRLAELLQRTRPADFAAMVPQIPHETENHPAWWVVLGQWYRQQNRPRLAAGCFLRSLKLDPNRQIAAFQLGQILTQQNHPLAADFRDRAEQLDKLSAMLGEIFAGDDSLTRMHEVSDQLELLGRYWESAAWAQLVTQKNHEDWALTRLRRIGRTLRDDLPIVRDDFNPAVRLPDSEFPVPDAATFASVAAGQTPTAQTSPDQLTPVSFEDVADDLGIRFHYFNGAVPGSVEHRMYEFTGGGVGVIDFDLDGRPEFWLPNGSCWPPGNDDQHTDSLLRNLDTRFDDVTQLAGVTDRGFGQGVSVGDFDNDGFPDVYVANTHRNQLMHNNGDGTFSDVTESAGLTTAVWTSSCLIADLNNDGHPDIYDVNFLAGDDVFTRTCEENGKPRSCPPAEFPGEQDRVFLNRGDGTFADVTETAGIVRPLGNGLGILAADFDGSGRLNLFIANDSVPNFYYVNASTPHAIAFHESSVLAGLDVDQEGHAQACMGVAAADVDGNGLLDLFITNFYNESNTLYLQQAENVFSDVARSSNIREISRELLGFGTQFLDADLNGLPDLVIANGHVDDFTHDKTPYQMQPQFLRHVGAGTVRYVEQKPTPPSRYFEESRLGRGLARLDYNGDGLDDFAVSHLDTPFALVENRTQPPGGSLSVRIIATGSARDALGSTVRVTSGDIVRTQQLTAGDGYMASNERRLTFGLGPATEPCTIEVRWISGRTETFEPVPVGSRVILVESAARALVEPR